MGNTEIERWREHLARNTVPECKAQAVCVNGRNCIDAGRCLRAGEVEVVPAADLRGAVERARRAERKVIEYADRIDMLAATMLDSDGIEGEFHEAILEVLRGRREQVAELRQQLRGAVQTRDALIVAGRRALAHWPDDADPEPYHKHAFEQALLEAERGGSTMENRP